MYGLKPNAVKILRKWIEKRCMWVRGAENGGPEKTGSEFAGPVFRKIQDRKMQDWILKDHLAGGMALSAVK